MIKVVVSRSIVDDVRALLEESGDHAPSVDTAAIELVAVDESAAGAELGDAEAAVRWDLDDDGFQRLLNEAPRLRWLHSPGAGVERWPLQELDARGITLTNGAGVFAIPIAEWVLSTMLTVVKHSDAVRQAQTQHRWAGDEPADELYRRTLLVLGTGGIGQEIIKRASAFEMRIWGSNRQGRQVEHADRVVQGDEWRALLPDADFVVSTVPLTAETAHMIGAAELSSFKSGAWLINVGRGGTIDEEALLQALHDQTIGGAALDAWTTEPLPADHPAWSQPNMIVSPHRSGSSPAGRDRGLRLFVANLRRFAAGEPMANVVDLSAGY
ncbi:D-2-hydroxyacid dehydrogenase [Microlunatus panaciterrae]|uniref:Phosphoglycerate dehydrogenase-like enzyme n=1 Tax=Microlunatus panaciterrae TaxID=400768 RepID=A0ABS2RL98_9ACTN|nr:phosphoglycerate dehydrogenase-like enzyme [Microlunatus panaciterrae]